VGQCCRRLDFLVEFFDVVVPGDHGL
jgi:hypothetical protein